MVEIAYKPIGTTNPSDADIKKPSPTPPYDDVGISYKGFSKTRISENKWRLNPQDKRFYKISIGSGAFGSTLSNRENTKKTFYCTKMFIQHYSISTFSLSLGQIHIGDVKENDISTIRFYFYPQQASWSGFIDFSDSPLKFSGNRFDLYTQASFSGADWLVVSLYGWEE